MFRLGNIISFLITDGVMSRAFLFIALSIKLNAGDTTKMADQNATGTGLSTVILLTIAQCILLTVYCVCRFYRFAFPEWRKRSQRKIFLCELAFSCLCGALLCRMAIFVRPRSILSTGVVAGKTLAGSEKRGAASRFLWSSSNHMQGNNELFLSSFSEVCVFF